MKKIVCLWGGPGTGKSTTCAGLFSKLKQQKFNVEMNREYPVNYKIVNCDENVENNIIKELLK